MHDKETSRARGESWVVHLEFVVRWQDVPATTSAKVLCGRVRGADVDGDYCEDAGSKSDREGVGDEGNGEGVGTGVGSTGGTALPAHG
ncbi:hypothetical protein J6590_049144 [Homalodisca vitripennis]|nr:hypothetical protein J6590_049144 [Homalodisca vitripennis]